VYEVKIFKDGLCASVVRMKD